MAEEKTEEQKAQERKEYEDRLRAQGTIEGSPDWNTKMEEYDAKAASGEDKDPLEGRPLKPSEIGQPVAEHARDQEEVAAKLDEQVAEHRTKTREFVKNREQLADEQRDLNAKIVDEKQQAVKRDEVLGWKQRIADGNTTQAEMAELKMHPEHTSVSSGHGNPAD